MYVFIKPRRSQRIDNESFKLRDLREVSVHSVVKLYFDIAYDDCYPVFIEAAGNKILRVDL